MGIGGGQEVPPLIGAWIGGQECSRQRERPGGGRSRPHSRTRRSAG